MLIFLLEFIFIFFNHVDGQTQSVPYPPDVTNHENLKLLDNNICGLYSSRKIISGENTGIFEFPWMTLLGRQHINGGNTEFFCAGTIINKRYILTAAHCVVSLGPNYFLREVRVGEHDTNTWRDCQRFYNGIIQNFEDKCTEGFQTYEIETILYHRDFSTINLQNDIALLRLKTDIDFQLPNVKPICLPIGTAGVFYGQKGIVTGWGKTKINSVSTKLLKAEIPLTSNDQCYRNFINFNYKQLCAGGQEGVDSCTGDSGGPFQNIGNYYNTLRMIQYGVISYGPWQCGIIGVPSVYTSIPYYMDWILDHMRD